ncbi:MAG: bifunctional DNA primase/polymerase [Chloroflexota bacterium]
MMQRDPITDTRKAFELHASIMARASEPLTHLQESAIDLYRRGFNTFPIPHASKEPFEGTSLKRLYNSRPHLCGDGVEPCRHGAAVVNFASLFTGRKNLAVMCGKTSDNLLGVDCDTQAAYETIGKELDALTLPYWAFTSHRGGCYLLRVIEDEAANVTKAASKFEGVELWGNSHYVILPMSIHPSGTVYRWRGDTEPSYHYATAYETLPAVRVTALTWLGVTLLKDDKPKLFEMFGLSAEYSVLSKRDRETLGSGASKGQRNSRLNAAAWHMKQKGFDYGFVESAILNAAAKCEPVYRPREALSMLKSIFTTSERKHGATFDPTNEPEVRIQRLYAFVNSYDWKATFGRKARTRRLVFSACVDRSAIEGETFRAAVRELAETVNRNYSYVGVCLRDLANKGLLRLATSWTESSSGANVYAFGDAFKHYCEKNTVTTTCNTNVFFSQYEKNTNTDAWKDVFGLKGLGVVAVEVLKALQAKQYKSIYAIAKDTGAAYNSVKDAVKRLIKHNLAIHSEAEGLYYAEPVTEAALLALSVKLQTNGRAEMQRIAHGIDREIFINRNLSEAMQPFNDVTGERR